MVLSKFPQHKANFVISNVFGKIRCVLTDHEMCVDVSGDTRAREANISMIENYVTANKKYLYMLEQGLTGKEEQFNYENFCRFIQPHKFNPKHQMYCSITKSTVNRRVDELIKHKNGKAFCKILHKAWVGKMKVACKTMRRGLKK